MATTLPIAEKIIILVNEARSDSYLRMFPGPEKFDSPQIHARLEAQFRSGVQWAVEILKRNDRVLWYLRYYLLALLTDQAVDQSYLKKLILKFENKGITGEKLEFDLKYIRSSLFSGNASHFLALPIPAIQDFVFEWQRPSAVFSHFRDLEEAWAKASKGFIPDQAVAQYNPEIEQLIDFGDGTFLFNLNINGCEQEAEAMSHCSTGGHSGDINWSIRRKAKYQGQEGWKPLVTLIWNEHDGRINEIKGATNTKPKPEYHPYIVQALLHPKVKGRFWPHNGYALENDFIVADLPEDQQLELFRKKPEVVEGVTRLDLAVKSGSEELVKDTIQELFEHTKDINLSLEKTEKGNLLIVFAKYEEGIDFFKYCSRYDLLSKGTDYYLEKLEDGFVDINMDWSVSDIRSFLGEVLSSNDSYFDLFFKILSAEGVEYDDDGEYDDSELVELILSESEGLPQAAYASIHLGYESGTQHELFQIMDKALREHIIPLNKEAPNLLYYPGMYALTVEQVKEMLRVQNDDADSDFGHFYDIIKTIAGDDEIGIDPYTERNGYNIEYDEDYALQHFKDEALPELLHRLGIEIEKET